MGRSVDRSRVLSGSGVDDLGGIGARQVFPAPCAASLVEREPAGGEAEAVELAVIGADLVLGRTLLALPAPQGTADAEDQDRGR